MVAAGAGVRWMALVVIAGMGVGRMTEAQVVRLAEIEVDGAQLAAYRAALTEEIAESVRLEPGVEKLYAVQVKGHPEQVRLFEVYRDTAAYEAHLKSAHFSKYKAATAGMVKSLKLVEVEPILLGGKT